MGLRSAAPVSLVDFGSTKMVLQVSMGLIAILVAGVFVWGFHPSSSVTLETGQFEWGRRLQIDSVGGLH